MALGAEGVFARREVIGEPGASGGVERVEEIERGSQGPLALAHASAAVGRELDTQAAAVESPGVDERTSAKLMNEVIGRLSSDEQATADLAGVKLGRLVEELHHLELGEGDAELEQGVGEAGSEDAVNAALRVDQAPSRGCLRVHRAIPNARQ